eukprot:m.100721 g.100721  ORF g.100721 m.100721 type:complete len:65 (+) comp9049_c1_seq1:39-233(+)
MSSTNKEELIQQVLMLQSTLDALSNKVEGVKNENTELRKENQELSQEIEALAIGVDWNVGNINK